MPDVQHKRGTRAALNALATTNGLKPGQLYVLTDEGRIAVALTPSTFMRMAKTTDEVVLTQAAYDALPVKDPDVTYHISG